MIGSFPYNGEAPLGHGSTKCVSPSQPGGPSLRARQHEMRKTFVDRDLELFFFHLLRQSGDFATSENGLQRHRG